jgi:2-polyprenyl-6-methoxyphenol hydroxylase-like FAD-dependent oxidoreductase
VHIVLIGGGFCGLTTALLLARDGHEVTVLERDARPVPDSCVTAWDDWDRKGVAQFRQPHNLMPGLRLLFEKELPEVNDGLARAGASRFDLIDPIPPFLPDRNPRPIDQTLWTLTARRPVGEWVLASLAQQTPRVSIKRGVKVTGLTTRPRTASGIPHVTGVRTQDGENISGDLVVDATGRQSRCAEWLEGVGARRMYEEQADSGFAYYTRYFRGTPPQRRSATLTAIGTISILTLPGDNDTWSVTVFCASGDQPLKALRHQPTWTRVVQACPLHAHWLDGEPLTDVLAMAGVVDRYRRLVVDGVPVATGIVAIADAWGCTNPSAGRGLTVGALHGRCLRDVLRDSTLDPRTLSERFDEVTEAEIAPWYRAQMAVDKARFAEMQALRDDRAPEPPADDLARRILTLFSVMGADADLFRNALEYIGTITPIQQILARPEVIERVRVARERTKGAPPPRAPGPNRAQLLDLVREA